jgi:hypothetical protein
MKARKKNTIVVLNEAAAAYSAPPASGETMVRTQVYLTPSEHAFVQREGERLGKPMAAVIREWIDQKMQIPEEAWLNNPLLQPPAEDTNWAREDGAINHDHYIYGGPKKYKKVKGKWVHLPPLP